MFSEIVNPKDTVPIIICQEDECGPKNELSHRPEWEKIVYPLLSPDKNEIYTNLYFTIVLCMEATTLWFVLISSNKS